MFMYGIYREGYREGVCLDGNDGRGRGHEAD